MTLGDIPGASAVARANDFLLACRTVSVTVVRTSEFVMGIELTVAVLNHILNSHESTTRFRTPEFCPDKRANNCASCENPPRPVPDVCTIGELCCGDCTAQSEMYHLTFGEIPYCGLDVAPEIVALNRSQHVRCLQGNVMDVESLRLFIEFNVLFFGPPLSVDCDGHRLLSFGEVTPSFPDFARLLWCELSYFGTCVFICPNTTTLGEVRRLYAQVKSWRPEVGLRLLHYSHATITGNGEEHAPRLKYIELWFSSVLPDEWEMCHSYPPP